GFGLDALGNHRHAQVVGNADDGLGEVRVFLVVGQVADEGAVDLQLVELEALEVGERGVAGAKVVDGQLDAQRVNRVERGRDVGQLGHEGALGDLEFEQ